MSNLRIDVWSDFVCPFCMLEEPVLDAISADLGSAVDIVWRAYELRPEPGPTLPPDGAYLHDIWSRVVYPMAAERGIVLRLPPVQPRSRLAHEATAYADREGQGDVLRRALFRAFFQDGRDIGSIDVLVDVATSLGLDASALRQALERGDFTAFVIEDQRAAAAMGIRGVPAMSLRRTGAEAGAPLLVSGAQPEPVLRDAIRRLGLGIA